MAVFSQARGFAAAEEAPKSSLDGFGANCHAGGMTEFLRLNNTVKRDPGIESWFSGFADPFRLAVQPWFERMRGLGSDVPRSSARRMSGRLRG